MTDFTIATLWRGGPLTWIEQACLTSWRDAGHDVRLYAWEWVDGVPDWIETLNAAAILPRAAAPDHLIADLFRYRLLSAEPETLWIDPDIALLRPLPEPADGRFFAHSSDGGISPGVLALPPESPALRALLAFTADPTAIPPWADDAERAELEARAEDGDPVHAKDHAWGHWGARALTHFLRQSGEDEAALPARAFHPVAYPDRAVLNQRKIGLDKVTGEETFGVRLYAEEWKRDLARADGGLPRYWSPFGELIRKTAVAPREAPVPGAPEAPAHLWADRVEKPAAPPAPKPTRKADPAGRVLIVTTMKNEGPFILEWIAYHRSIGVTDFLVYTNDCDDGTDAFHDLLAEKGVIAEHLDNPFRTMNGVKPQHAALWNSQTRPVAQEADWIIGMDVDEFINIHVGEGRFQDLLDAVPDANMISMTWRLFGNGFVRDFEDGFVTEKLLHCAHERARKPHQAWGFKTAFRNTGIYRKFGVHRPKGLKPDRAGEINWVDSNGRQMPESYHQAGWRASKRNWGYGLVTLNHYSLRSSESYLVKRDRGRVNHVDRDQGLAYWFRMNHNAVEDRSILPKLPAAKAEFDRLMEDPDIRAMHERCVLAHRAKIDELMERPDYRELFETIESKRMKNLSRMLMNFGNAIFHEGPHAVPEEFLKQADELEPEAT
ncbi:MAG: glycosyltransferase family 2 protein [Pseudomonadota bacterium]